MTLADVPRPPAAEAAPVPGPSPAARPAPAPVRPWLSEPAARRTPAAEVGEHGLSRTAGRLLAGLLALAWIACPAVEPLPEHDVAYPLWQLPIDLATVGTIVGAVVASWRGTRSTAPLTVAAGTFMAIQTAICPFAGHTPVGWWTWVQAGCSLLVMAIGVALYRIRRA